MHEIILKMWLGVNFCDGVSENGQAAVTAGGSSSDKLANLEITLTFIVLIREIPLRAEN